MTKYKRYDPTKWIFNQLLFCVVIVVFIALVMMWGCGCETTRAVEIEPVSMS